ncbi:Ribosomal large subunit pseudouridine synthase C [Endomicrobium proavitum]|uniref:Pseudouridine synthase n=2 Tax=Endomicrobium proavitum TaxID=1408281 RepID=A0A0G3WK40_9BACT|nr:Ribosomal large subunit pseudouridine synthase C [Endomicrobium proavitum]
MKPPIEIIYQDDNILVINKPPKVLVIPDQHTHENRTLVGLLKKKLNQKIWVVHRIDRDTTGVLVFAKNAEAHRNLSMQFEKSQVKKKYIALLSGVLEEDEGAINKPILVSDRDVSIDDEGKDSITDFTVLERFKSYTLVEARPQTGRRHQIRIHFWSLGHPLAIDSDYGVYDPILLSAFKRNYKEKDGQKEKPLIDRLTLHAAELTLTLPATKEQKTFTAPLPKDFEITLKQLRKYYK